MSTNKPLSPTILLTATIMNAVLYGVFSLATASITSPLLAGRFRPAVVIPAFFATIFGPMCGGIGATIGTLIADSLTHGGDLLYGGSWFASMPGNFIGFFLFGYIVKKFSWKRFILASEITLTVANAIVGFLYVFIFKFLYLGDPKYVSMPLGTQIFYSVGLTLWWFVTMLPFVLLLTPLLIRATASAFPSIVSQELRNISLSQDLSMKSFSFALLFPGVIMLGIGLLTNYTSLGVYISNANKQDLILIQWMFYLSGATLSILGALVYAKKKPYTQLSTDKTKNG